MKLESSWSCNISSKLNVRNLVISQVFLQVLFFQMDRKTLLDLGSQSDSERVRFKNKNLTHAAYKSFIYFCVTPLSFYDVSVAEATIYTVEILPLCFPS